MNKGLTFDKFNSSNFHKFLKEAGIVPVSLFPERFLKKKLKTNKMKKKRKNTIDAVMYTDLSKTVFLQLNYSQIYPLYLPFLSNFEN